MLETEREKGFAEGVEFAAKVMEDLDSSKWFADAIRLRSELVPREFQND
jgi:hypothetical protein